MMTQALAKSLAYKEADKPAEAYEWAVKLVQMLEDCCILESGFTDYGRRGE